MSNSRKLTIVAVTMVSTLLLVPFSTFATETPKNTSNTYRLLNLFGDVFERVRADYVEQPTDEKLIEAAINGMLTALDPHSSFMNAKSFRDMQVNTRGKFGGLGIQVTMEAGFVKVISPIDDTPAHRAGVEAGDFITHLDGKPVQGLTLSQAVERMRGKIGADIKLTIRRKSVTKPFDIKITRAVIKLDPVSSRIEEKVGYVRIKSFNEQTDKGLEKAMARFQDELGKTLVGVVLDLRNNPGGLLDQAVSVSDAFLERGEIVSTRSREPEDTRRYNATPGDLALGLPVVVLINGGSASASEIVAGALQDHRRAIVLGTRSFGKGSVQTIMPLSGHGAMRLTTARYFTPSGRSIQAKGIDPDIVVEPSKIEKITIVKNTREADLHGALKNTGTNDDSKSSEKKNAAAMGPSESNKPNKKPNKKTAPSQDYQLTRALDLLRGLSLYSNALIKQTN